jgi:hypothetical protein
VITRFYVRLTILSLLIIVTCSTAFAWTHKKGQKARVTFLATSTLIRGTFGPNEDTYLAELSLDKDSEHVLIRLIDAYPNEAPPLSQQDLIAPSGITLRVRRDFECDRPYGQMIIRTAPGDPMAILPVRLEFQPQLERVPSSNARLPCYRIARR